MQYQGGKYIIRNQIAQIINNLQPEIYIEPFLGGCSILPLIKAPRRIGSDIHLDLMLMWKAVKHGWIPPSEVTKEKHHEVLNRKYANAESGLIGFFVSYRGRWKGGYSYDVPGKYVYKTAVYNKIIELAPLLVDVELYLGDYQQVCKRFETNDDRTVIYCDPPYEGRERYRGTPRFDFNRYWDWISTNKNTLVMSGYDSKGYQELSTLQKTCTMWTGYGLPRIEKVFYKPGKVSGCYES